jgi:hypothetical protein
VGTICFWFIHQLPYYFLQDLVITGGVPACVTTNTIFTQYRNYFIYLGLYTLIPVAVISTFGFLTVKHMRITAVKHSLTVFTRQMINMASFQVIAVLIFNGPYAVWQIYSMNTASVSKAAYQRAQEQLANTFFAVYDYGPYTVKIFLFTKIIIITLFSLEFFLLLLYIETVSGSTVHSYEEADLS